MTMKMRRISETAYREPTGAAVGPSFNYAKFFFLVIVVVVASVVGLYFIVQHFKGNVKTSNAWVEYAIENDIKAEADIVITKMHVQVGDIVEKGKDMLFEAGSIEGSEAESEINKMQAKIDYEKARLEQIMLGTNISGSRPSDVQRRLLAAKDAWDDAITEKEKAGGDFSQAEQRYNDAKEFFDEYLITKDKLDLAKNLYLKAEADHKNATGKELRRRAAYDVVAEEAASMGIKSGDSSAKKSREEAIKAQKSKIAGAKADLAATKAKYIVEKKFLAPISGRVCWARASEGMVEKGAMIMKIIDPNSIEVHAKIGDEIALDIHKEQVVDIEVNTGDEILFLKGKVGGKISPIFKFSSAERDKMRAQNPNFEANKRLVRILLEESDDYKKAKEKLDLGHAVSITIHTR